jgi:hypothetical protein
VTQECPACGQTYGLTHTCPGAIASANAPADEWVAPKGFAPLFYLREAIAIAKFEDGAIIGASRDEVALVYGAIIWLLSRFVIYSVRLVLPYAQAIEHGYILNWTRIEMGILFGVIADTVWALAQYGVCHLCARWWFGARGTYVGILRAMWLGSFVSLTLLIPYVGTLVAGIWMLAILMRVFEEIDGIERMKAFALSFGFGFFFFILGLTLLSWTRR